MDWLYYTIGGIFLAGVVVVLYYVWFVAPKPPKFTVPSREPVIQPPQDPTIQPPQDPILPHNKPTAL